jgi:glucose-6-phosphate isomerase
VGVMPYDHYLKRLPAHLQQPTMESSDNHSLGLNRICQ